MDCCSIALVLATLLAGCSTADTGRHAERAPEVRGDGPWGGPAERRLRAGPSDSCAVLENGTIHCWGAGAWPGRDRDREHTGVPTLVDGVTGAADVALSDGHACALLREGTVACWGDNEHGQLGTSASPNYVDAATPVPGLARVQQLVAGEHYTCARRSDGTVYCWGLNDVGQLGDGTTTDRFTPTPVAHLRGAEMLAAGPRHVCALVSGSVWCWGDNSASQLGDETVETSSAPIRVEGLPSAAIGVAVGGEHSCALLSDHTVRCWGAFAERGEDRAVMSARPTLDPGWSGVEQLVLGDTDTCALLQGGVQCWHSTEASQRVLPGLTNVTQLALGSRHGCALLGGHDVRCWGRWEDGQTGPIERFHTPTQVTGLTDVVSLIARQLSTCALRSDHTVMCWGNLTPDREVTVSPLPVRIPGWEGVVALAGGETPCAISRDREVRCLSRDPGRLVATDAAGYVRGSGIGCVTSRSSHTVICWMDSMSSAAPVPALRGAPEVDATYFHACARRSDGTVLCWGGEHARPEALGPGGSSVPTVVAGVSHAVQVGVGGDHSCALVASGGVSCWGWNSFGELGDGTLQERAAPSPVVGISDAVQIAVGCHHTCARLRDGTVQCWGWNLDGQLGDGTTSDRNVPTTVPGLADVTDLSAGGGHTCAALRDGTVRCWGDDAAGQLGVSATDVPREFEARPVPL